jgi:hypothetical protein
VKTELDAYTRTPAVVADEDEPVVEPAAEQ